MLTRILKPFASLRLTVILLAKAMVVIFAGTWAQIDHGIWEVQKKYFHSFGCIIDFKIFLPRQQPELSHLSRPVAAATEFALNGLSQIRLPWLGGYSLIILLLINLLAAHTVRFKLNWKRAGMLILHAGLILLICGEVVTSQFQVEQQMVIQEGETVSYASDVREAELAVIDPSPADHDNVAVVPASRLAKQGLVFSPDLPFEIHVDKWFANSRVLGPFQAKGHEDARATAGAGVGLTVIDVPKFSGTNEAASVDAPSAYVTLSTAGQKLGTYLVSLFLDNPQKVQVGDKTYLMALRFKRYYKPFSIQLLKFSFDRFTGTNVARNYSSKIRIFDPEQKQDREVLIWMNHPLRYRGEAFFQADFNHETEHGTVLQVVRNPGWMIPYISCTMVALGMLIHFGGTLFRFVRKTTTPAPISAPVVTGPSKKKKDAQSRAKSQPPLAPSRPGLLIPGIITACCAIYLFSIARMPKQEGQFDLPTFAQMPVSYEGRVMPLDSLARNSLRIISGKSSLFVEDKTRQPTWFHKMFDLPVGKDYPAIYWLANVMSKPEEAAEIPFVRIDHPDLLSQLGLDEKQKRFSVKQIMLKRDVLEQQAQLAQQVQPKNRDLYQKKVLELVEHLNLFFKLAAVDDLFVAAPVVKGDEWKTVHDSMAAAKGDASQMNPGVRATLTMLEAYHNGDADTFNAAGTGYESWLEARHLVGVKKAAFEVLFNNAEPFYAAIILYVLIFLLICFSWLGWGATLQRTALWVLMVTLIFHTIALASRIYIQGRPPVTNLYSSAIFIAWGVAVMCLGLELLYRNGFGSLMAATIGFLSLIIAHNLAGSGDTMQMMQAVLDTNIWLATHVVVVTLGYAATFLAGSLAVVYVLMGVFTPRLKQAGRVRLHGTHVVIESDGRAPIGDEQPLHKIVAKMVYGILCFAMLFSFVGTVLGGIWADQSWGRFWGWDPKENGAVLIVFWNALILHARWGGLVQARGMMNLTIFGNAVTSWSWFGTNMLGVGLHSYGFMDSAVFWLVAFVLLQFLFIVIGSLPLSMWRSFKEATGDSGPLGTPAPAV